MAKSIYRSIQQFTIKNGNVTENHASMSRTATTHPDMAFWKTSNRSVYTITLPGDVWTPAEPSSPFPTFEVAFGQPSEIYEILETASLGLQSYEVTTSRRSKLRKRKKMLYQDPDVIINS